MSDNIAFVSVIGVILFMAGLVGVSSHYADIKKAEAGLQECYVSNHQNPVWMRDCPK